MRALFSEEGLWLRQPTASGKPPNLRHTASRSRDLRQVNSGNNEVPTLQSCQPEIVMPQPTDAARNFACATLRNASRAAEFFVDSQLHLARLRVKMAETALQNLSQLEGQLDTVKDWSTLASAQSAYMKLQADQSANAVRQWADFLNDTQRSYLRQATDWNDQFQHRPGTTATPAQLLIASLDSWQTLVNTFNVIAASATQARSTSQPQTTPKSARGA
ncbi:hypothetical protein [Ralstonia holmesii]|uniref:hypothetical protein n=1 Tax=Ralstonia holmesii TaxID=3058602 RepID=UPI0029303334|nr:hypothetical protein [Ralstonia sp. LMG 32967]